MSDNTHDADHYDSELDVASTPPISDLVRLMRANLSESIRYVESDPPLLELRARSSQIMDDIQIGSGLPGAEDLAVELALAVDDKFERLGLGRSWYQRLLELWDAAVERAGELGEAHLFQCLIRHYMHSGDMVRASKLINDLLDIAALTPDAPVQEAMIGAASVASSLGDTGNGEVLAEQLLELAELTGNYMLMGRAYGVLNRFYASQHKPDRAFEYGQMVYCVGIGLDNEMLIQNGLHYIALAFQIAKQPTRAFPYLDRLKQYSQESGDVSQKNYLWYTLGACLYQNADYEQAKQCFLNCLNTFDPGAWVHTTAIYLLGLTLMRLHQFEESEQRLLQAYEAWGKQKRDFEQLYARHGLAHLRWFQHRHAEAVEIAEQTLAQAEAADNVNRQQLLDELRKDVEKYRQSLHSASSSQFMIDYVHE
jgi:tetratricopeptide (TPR) repeat protein